MKTIEEENPKWASYGKAVGPTLKQYEGQPVALRQIGGMGKLREEVKEGTWEVKRTILIRFPNFEKAKAWYESPEYSKIIKDRTDVSTGSMAIFAGLPDKAGPSADEGKNPAYVLSVGGPLDESDAAKKA